jgi:hypothetical protein
MKRTIKDATVKRYFYESHDDLRNHLRDFVDACNIARRLKMSNDPLVAGKSRALSQQQGSDKPADGDIDAGLAHQAPIMDDLTRRPASMRRTATSGSIPGRPLFSQ